MNKNISIITDLDGTKFVLIRDIRFKGKTRNEWNQVEEYLKEYSTVTIPSKDENARTWYEKEAFQQAWSVKTLQRNISSQYYYRMLQTRKRELVKVEMKEITANYQNDKLEFIKNPVIAEFLGISSNADFTENDLEKSVLSNLQKFLMELGKGYAFVARQQHIHTEKQDHASGCGTDGYVYSDV